MLAENASWLFRVAPYLIFAATWVAAALVPTFATGLLFSWTADLIAITALLGSARFFLALAGMDVGTSFGGIGSSREVMIASLAEPAMIMIVFTLALVAGSTQLSTIAHDSCCPPHVGLRVSLGLALVALIIVAIAENARIPVDNPATHLELTMVHEAMVLEYSGRHLAVIELAASLKLLLYISLIACIFVPWGLAHAGAGPAAYAIGIATYVAKLAVGGLLLALFETVIAKMRVFRVPDFLGAALMLGPARHAPPLRLAEPLDGRPRLRHRASPRRRARAGELHDALPGPPLRAAQRLRACTPSCLAFSVGWQAYIQDAPHLYITAAIALVFKAIIIPVALHRIIQRLGIHREIETVVGIGPTMLLRHRARRLLHGGHAATSQPRPTAWRARTWRLRFPSSCWDC